MKVDALVRKSLSNIGRELEGGQILYDEAARRDSALCFTPQLTRFWLAVSVIFFQGRRPDLPLLESNVGH